MIHRTNAVFDNILFTTEYSVTLSTTVFFTTLQVDALQINITNCDITVKGRIWYSESPLQLFLRNLNVDYYQNSYGFYVIVKLGEQNAIQNSLVDADNMYHYYSQPKLANLGQRHALIYQCWGNMIVRNSRYEIYSDKNDGSCPISRFALSDCGPFISETDEMFITLLENIYITNPYTNVTNFGDAETSIRMKGPSSNPINVTFSNITFENAYTTGSQHTIQLYFPSNYIVNLRDITFKDIIADIPIISLTGSTQIYFDNIKFINCTIYSTTIISSTGSDIFSMNNITFTNMTMPSVFSDDYIDIVSKKFLFLYIRNYFHEIHFG